MNDDTILFGTFMLFLPHLTEECLEKDMQILNAAERPEELFGKEVMKDMNLITFGQYADLCDAIAMENHVEAMRTIIKTIYEDVSDIEIDAQPVESVWGFCNFAIKETDRINKLFSSVHIEYTEQEKKAGIDKLQFGTFGILDWYARRMGIVDQNLVNNEKWVRIYQCMKNDTEEAAYNRRLQKVYEDEAKRRSHR